MATDLTNSLSSGASSFIVVILARISSVWLLTTLLVVLLVVYFLKTFLVDLIISARGLCMGDRLPSKIIDTQEFVAKGDKDFITSYRMESNTDYEDIMAIMQSFSKKV